MVDINKEDFDTLPQESKNNVLFDGQCGVEQALKDLKASVDVLVKSPWRMAIPPVSWKAIGGFVLVLALIIRGDADKALKLLGALLGIG